MLITLALQSPEQINGACRTTANHIRLGYPYCSLVGQENWPIEKIAKGIEAIIAAGKRPQLALPFSSLEKAEESYWQKNVELLNEYPQVEVVVSSWGVLKLPVHNSKIASVHLNALNKHEISILKQYGVKIVSLPLKLRDENAIRTIITSNADMAFEYHLDGDVLSTFGWLCRSTAGTVPKGNGNWCMNPKVFMPQENKKLPSIHARGGTVWLGQQMSSLQQVQHLAAWGIKRGVIHWGTYDFDTIEQLITLYQIVLTKGTTAIEKNKFFQELRKQIRFHYFN